MACNINEKGWATCVGRTPEESLLQLRASGPSQGIYTHKGWTNYQIYAFFGPIKISSKICPNEGEGSFGKIIFVAIPYGEPAKHQGERGSIYHVVNRN